MRTATCFLLALLTISTWVTRLSAVEPSPSLQDYQQLAALFSPPGTPHFADKPWVQIESGSGAMLQWDAGWLIEKSDDHLVIFRPCGDLRRLDRPAPDAVRKPPWWSDKYESSPFGPPQAVDLDVAWVLSPSDYLTTCRKVLTEGFPQHRFTGHKYPQLAKKYATTRDILSAARYVHFAHVLQDSSLAGAWYKRLNEMFLAYRQEFKDPDSQAPLLAFLAIKASADRYDLSISVAHTGAPREELLFRCRWIAAMPDHASSGQAREMVAHYQRMLAEDAKWREPTTDEQAKFTTDQQVDYWMHHLRDWDAGSVSGECDVFCRTRYLLEASLLDDDFAEERRNPAEELTKLGAAALPKIIAHLDDRRPTRCRGYVEHDGEKSHYLLRYGDCCQQIFEAITHTTIKYRHETGACATFADQEKNIKAAAEIWWEQNQAAPSESQR